MVKSQNSESQVQLGHGRSFILCVAAAVLIGAPASAFVVSGTIFDSLGTPLPYIMVEIRDADPGSDQLLATVHTDAAGNYTATITEGWGPEWPDIYLRVYWKFIILPAADYNDHHIIVTKETPTGQVYTESQSPVTPDHDPGTNLIGKNHWTPETMAIAGPLHDHINEALDYYRDYRGPVPWELTYDINVEIWTGQPVNKSYFFPSGPAMVISPVSVLGLGPDVRGYVSTVYHEMAHYVMWKFYGDNFPPMGGYGCHVFCSERDRGFALVEGWASYVAEMTDDIHGDDNAHEGIRDNGSYYHSKYPAGALWRGDEGWGTDCEPIVPYPTGLDNPNFESGEVVEGAVGAVWCDLHDTYGHGFWPNLYEMFFWNPDNIFEFREGFILHFALGQDTNLALQNHGIVFDRAAFAMDPFDEGGPGDSAPPADGNMRVIDGVTHLRGNVTTDFEAVHASNLGVQQTVVINEVRVWRNHAQNGVNGSAALVMQTPTSWVSFTDGSIELETGNWADDDYDLLIQAKNVDSFEDNFSPTWLDDNTQAVDTDEKYLKTIGAWYDRDRQPTDDNGGKVVVDNTPPQVINFMPQ